MAQMSQELTLPEMFCLISFNPDTEKMSVLSSKFSLVALAAELMLRGKVAREEDSGRPGHRGFVLKDTSPTGDEHLYAALRALVEDPRSPKYPDYMKRHVSFLDWAPRLVERGLFRSVEQESKWLQLFSTHSFKQLDPDAQHSLVEQVRSAITGTEVVRGRVAAFVAILDKAQAFNYALSQPEISRHRARISEIISNDPGASYIRDE